MDGQSDLCRAKHSARRRRASDTRRAPSAWPPHTSHELPQARTGAQGAQTRQLRVPEHDSKHEVCNQRILPQESGRIRKGYCNTRQWPHWDALGKVQWLPQGNSMKYSHILQGSCHAMSAFGCRLIFATQGNGRNGRPSTVVVTRQRPHWNVIDKAMAAFGLNCRISPPGNVCSRSYSKDLATRRWAYSDVLESVFCRLLLQSSSHIGMPLTRQRLRSRVLKSSVTRQWHMRTSSCQVCCHEAKAKLLSQSSGYIGLPLPWRHSDVIKGFCHKKVAAFAKVIATQGNHTFGPQGSCSTERRRSCEVAGSSDLASDFAGAKLSGRALHSPSEFVEIRCGAASCGCVCGTNAAAGLADGWHDLPLHEHGTYSRRNGCCRVRMSSAAVATSDRPIRMSSLLPHGAMAAFACPRRSLSQGDGHIGLHGCHKAIACFNRLSSKVLATMAAFGCLERLLLVAAKLPRGNHFACPHSCHTRQWPHLMSSKVFVLQDSGTPGCP